MLWSKKSPENITVGQVMTRNPTSIPSAHHLFTAKKLMNQKRIRHLPIVDGNEIIGIVSERDVRLTSSLFQDQTDKEIRIRDLCLMEPYIVEEDVPLSKVLKQMVEEKYGSVLIQKNGKLSGIFTMIDAGGLLQEMLKQN